MAEHQPEKLAAAEWHFETEEAAPLILWGILDDNQEVQYGIEIPYALSILAHSNPMAEVTGLEEFPEELQPPLIIHYFFDTMVTIGMFMLALSFVYVVAKWRNWQFVDRKWYRWLIVLGGPLSFLAIQAGWWMSEVGRQPWILRGIMTVDEAATTASYVDLVFIGFVLLYFILGVGTIVVLRKMFRGKPVEKELKEFTGGDER